MNFSKAEVIKTKDVPQRQGAIDYTPLFKKLATIVDDTEAVRIPIDKAHYVSNIQKAIDKEFKHAKYKAFQRTIAGQMYCFITKI